MKKSISFLLSLLLIFSLSAAQAESFTVTDMMDREITFSSPASRIIALMPGDCEILCALGCEDMLAGRGTYCDYPPSISSIPAVESGELLNLEQILSLSPQVVLMSDMAQTAEQIQALESAGIQVVVTDADDIAGVYYVIRMIGEITGKANEAEMLISDMQSAFDQIASQSPATQKTVYFEISPLQQGLWTGGPGTFMDEIAALCGLENIFSDVQRWAQVSQEQVLARNPDYIVTTTMYYGGDLSPAEEILSRSSWQSLSAIQNGAVYNADNDEITRPGPRLKDAAISLFEFICEHEGLSD